MPTQITRVGMQSLLAVLWELSMFFIFGDIFLTNRFEKPALILVSVSAIALTVSFSYFKKADKWLLPMGELMVGLVLGRKELYPGMADLSGWWCRKSICTIKCRLYPDLNGILI